MIGHLFKLVWNRRRANTLILLELLISFLGLSFVLTASCFFLSQWNEPLGFEYERVWGLETGIPYLMEPEEVENAGIWATMDQLALMLSGMDEIESFSPLSWNVPFGSSASGYHNYLRGKELFVRDSEVRPALLETLGLKLVAGRWLEEGDAALSWKAVVLTRDYAEALFGDEDPIGRDVVIFDEAGAPMESEEGNHPPRRIVGVVETIRDRGEFSEAYPSQFSLVKWGPPAWPPAHFLLKLREGVPAVFEEELVRSIEAIAPGWRPSLSSLSADHDRLVRDVMVPVLLFAAVVLFLFIMVGLGLSGVLWQTVTRRTDEIGLRRALGASAGAIRRQLLGEMLALTTVAVGIGSLLYLHVPLLRLYPFPDVPLAVYVQGLMLTWLVVYSFVLVCGLYPSWLATRVQPAAALQHE